MTLLTLLSHPVAQAVGRALLHFLWQGALMALLVWLIKTIAPPSGARFRYAAATLVMMSMPVAVVVTASIHPRRVEAAKPHAQPSAPTSTTAEAMATDTRTFVISSPAASKPRPGVSGWAVCLWIAGVLLLSLRALGGWSRAQRLKRGAASAAKELDGIISELTRRLRISTPVRLYTSAIVQVPIVVGWLRPHVLLPVTTLTGLTESQIRAILAHELAHIRRHDYIVNLLQTAIETALFYHPAVWWVGKQMRIEREHCCDDIAVGVCADAVEYATALAELEEIRGRIPEPALAATGGDLLSRIRRLLGEPDRRPGSLAPAVLTLSIVIASAVVSLHAQEPTPAFEVASIRPTKAETRGPRYRMGAQFTVESATLQDLVKMAYGLKDFQLSGGPSWSDADRFDIEAKADPPPQPGTIAALTLQRRRLQALLADRFKLTVHRETKQLPIYELVLAKGGPKIQPLKEGACAPFDFKNPGAGPGKNPMDTCGFFGLARGLLEGSSVTMADIAGGLSTLTGRIVVDKTGLAGTYRVYLTFVPDESLAPMPAPPGENSAPAADGPSLYTALEEQLGLKLESAKGPVEVVVIDHAEKPSEN